MNRKVPLVTLRNVVFLVCFVVVLFPVAASADDHDHPPPPAMSPHSPEATLRIDARTIAAERGWNEEATVARLKREEAMGAFVARLATDYSDTFAGAWTGDGPDGQVFVRFVGRVPAEVQRQAEQLGLAAAFEGGAKQSLARLQARADRVHAHLLALGHPEVATAVAAREEQIVATATRPPGNTRSDEELRARLPEESRASDVAITFAERPIAGYHHTYGGDRIFNSSTGSWCTSGFTVSNGTSSGMSTAGHCTGINTYRQEDGLTFGTSFKRQHRGDWGDLEWHTTTHIDYPQFYSNVGYRRDTLYLASAGSILQNNYYCRFGRRTGYHCDEVYLTSVSVSFDGYTHRRLVAMKQKKADGGDSGGPWFIGNRAAGIHSGWVTLNGINYDTWSKADYLDEAVGVRVMLK